MPQPTAGRIVNYRLTSQDVMSIGDEAQIQRKSARVVSGEIVPAMVLAVRGTVESQWVNLALYLDGSLGLWFLPGAVEGDRPGQWSWPERT